VSSPGTEGAGRAPGDPMTPVRSRAPTVLVAHERGTIGRIVTRVLGHEGFAATFVPDGKAALGELSRIGWDGFGWSPVTWGILAIVTSSIIGLITRFRLDDPILGGAMVWGYLAIVVQQQQRPLVALFAGLAAALVLLSLFVRDRQAPHSTHSECAEV